MFDLVILFFLLIGFLAGLKRGFILQAIHMAGFIIAFITAYVFYGQLAPKLVLWIPYPNFGGGELSLFLDNPDIENAYYRAIAFVAIFFGVKIVLQIIGSMFDFVANLPILKSLNIWAGGLLGFAESYLMTFIVLFILALLPIGAIQEQFVQSSLAGMIVEHTPILSDLVRDWWFEAK